jgi:hypothetical protein
VCGLRVSDLSRFLFAVAGEIERRLIDHLRRSSIVRSARTSRRALERLAQEFPTLLETPDYCDRAAEIRESKGRDLNRQLVLLIDRVLGDKVVLTLAEAEAFYPVPLESEALGDAIASWSLGFGDLADVSLAEIHNSNPIRTKPFLRLDGAFALVLPQLIQSFAVQMIEALLSGHPDLIDRYRRRRGRYLEQRGQSLFVQGFPAAEVLAGVAYRPDDAVSDHEADILMLLDDTAVIVELKSNTVRPAARRGAEGSVEDAIERLMIEPAQQAETFERYLRAHGRSPKIKIDGRESTVDLSRIRHFLRLTVTYEQLGLWAQPNALREVDLLPNGLDIPRPLLLSDLEVIFEVLPTQAARMDFLERRTWFDRSANWVGDDFDLLAVYLHNHLRVDVPARDTVVLMTHHSVELEPYLMGRERGWGVSKPQLEMTPLWRDLITRIEGLAIDGWLEPCRQLLSIEPPIQRNFARDVADLVRRISNGSSAGELLILQPNPGAGVAICAFAYERRLEDDHVAIANRSLQSVLESDDSPGRILVLGFTPGRRLPQKVLSIERRVRHPL